MANDIFGTTVAGLDNVPDFVGVDIGVFKTVF